MRWDEVLRVKARRLLPHLSPLQSAVDFVVIKLLSFPVVFLAGPPLWMNAMRVPVSYRPREVAKAWASGHNAKHYSRRGPLGTIEKLNIEH
jgi:hypothetical protein